MNNAPALIKKCLEKAGLSMDEIDIIAFSRGPGIPNCLRVGSAVARFLSLKYKKPLVPVNHCIAHIEIGKFETGCKDPVVVYLSGGNTQILAFVEGRYRVFGETIDIAVGNALDVLAREMGFPMPGGPEIEKLAKRGKWIELPYVVKGMDVSFTGILTEAIKKFREGCKPEDVAFSMQEVCFSMLTEISERALAHTGKDELLLVGGVAANKRLREMMKIMCKERGAKFYVVSPKYSSDNGVMIALSGLLAFQKGLKFEDGIDPKWRVDEVDWVES